MRLLALALVLALCCGQRAARAHQRYHEKTRFDRSIDDNADRNSYGIINGKPRVFTDSETHFTAYKDAAQSVCYLEKIRSNELDNVNLWRDVIRANKKKLYAAEHSLTKIEAWRLAGGRIVDFCRGMTMILLQETKPDASIMEDPFYNELPEDENDIIQKRIADVVLRPLKVRLRREAILEERRRLNEQDLVRRKREARGFRGQTQSQYMNVGADGQREGKAEAEATQQSSRAVVSGSSGMGQAQSMSSGSDGCEGCPGYGRAGNVPAGILGTLASQQGIPTGVESN